MPSSSVMDLTSPYPFFFVFVIPESKFQRLLAGLSRCGSAREGLVWKGKREDPSSISSIHMEKLDVAMYACSHDTGKRPRAETKGPQGGLIVRPVYPNSWAPSQQETLSQKRKIERKDAEQLRKTSNVFSSHHTHELICIYVLMHRSTHTPEHTHTVA